tara:strand:- start:1707 stop:2213 length:507 start_codon:yes stop_codon:yes gene_type:complete
MESNLIISESNCTFCKKTIEPTDAIFCNHCGHPEKGTDQQRAQFFAKRAVQKNKNIDAVDKIKSARNTLFVLSGLIAIFGFVGYSSNNSVLDLSINLLLSVIYLALAFWSEKNAMMALLLSLLLYITTIAIFTILEPTTLMKGLIWKIVIISYLGKGMYSASAVKKQE